MRIFQSTLLQEERHKYAFDGLEILLISIHAPTRGATEVDTALDTHILFQSTLLQEERRCQFVVEDEEIKISIHAPTRGATTIKFNFSCVILISIHAPTRGATQHTKDCIKPHYNFNPRSYKRSDIWTSFKLKWTNYFNPRSYKRSDG